MSAPAAVAGGERRAGAPAVPPHAPGGAIEWVFDPWRERPRRTALQLVVALGLVVLVAASGLPWPVGLVLGVAVAVRVARDAFPARCRVDDSGVAVHGPLGWEHRAWERVTRVRTLPGGLLVLTRRLPGPLAEVGALWLPVGGRDHEDVLGRLQPLLGHHDA